jgi:hypothetical protein
MYVNTPPRPAGGIRAGSDWLEFRLAFERRGSAAAERSVTLAEFAIGGEINGSYRAPPMRALSPEP